MAFTILITVFSKLTVFPLSLLPNSINIPVDVTLFSLKSYCDLYSNIKQHLQNIPYGPHAVPTTVDMY